VNQSANLEHLIFDHSISFEEKALAVFQFQYQEIQIYRAFCDHLGIDNRGINSLEKIPFLPIEFFKTHPIIPNHQAPEKVFASSGTTGQQTSQHYIAKLDLYNRSILNGFLGAKGKPEDYCILGLLPSYLERENASLVYMVDFLMKQSKHPKNDFYLDDFQKLATTIQELENTGQKTLLIGVTFALLDFAEQFQMPLEHVIITETGGMKGRRAELTRDELHRRLLKAFPGTSISSEYGMTEMLSQAYLRLDGKFQPASTLKILTREINDPFAYTTLGHTGALNVIDLANLYSCSFIATQDIGKLHHDNTFEVLGRMDHSDLRGCNLMVL